MDIKELALPTPSPSKNSDKIPSVKFTLPSARKPVSYEENLNEENLQQKAENFSKRVREENRQKVLRSSKRKLFQKHANNEVYNGDSEEDISLTEQSQQSEFSESTGDVITSYQRYRQKRCNTFDTMQFTEHTMEKEQQDDHKDFSLVYSLSSSDSEEYNGIRKQERTQEQEETKSETSLSDYYSAGKHDFTNRFEQQSIDMSSNFHSYRKRLEDSMSKKKKYFDSAWSSSTE